MQAYILTSTFYLIINVCGHWCQLVGRPSRVFWHWSRAPWVTAAYILPLQITQRHWRARVPLGRPRLGAAVAVAAPSTAAPITGVTGHTATRKFIQTSFLLYVYYNSVTWLLTIYFLFPDHGAVFCDSL